MMGGGGEGGEFNFFFVSNSWGEKRATILRIFGLGITNYTTCVKKQF